WWCVVCRAFRDAKQVVGHNLTKTAIGYIGTCVAFGIYGYLEGGQRAFGKVEWWLSTILGGFAVFVIILLYQILKAPQKLQDEAAAEAATHSERLQSRLD